MTPKSKISPCKKNRADGFSQPAEYDPQTAVWLGWPTFQWYTSVMDTRITIADIIVVLNNYSVSVNLMCTDASGEASILQWYSDNGHLAPDVNFIYVNQVDIWQRDMGPTFLTNSSGGIAIAGFKQNEWGYDPGGNSSYSVEASAIPGLAAAELGILDFYQSEFFSEGGDRICDGCGTLLVCQVVELQRNPDKTILELEAEFRNLLGVTNIIWIDDGIRDDLHADWGPIPYTDESGGVILLYGPQTVGGHLDEFVRFAPNNTIVVAQVTTEEAATNPIMAVNYARLEKTVRILSAATDAAGQPFVIERIPVPDVEYMEVTSDQPMYYNFLQTLTYPPSVPQFPVDGSPVYVVKAASYANYLITNGVVVGQGYGNSTKELVVRSQLSQIYGREVELVDPSAVNYCGGGIHCITQHQPSPITIPQ